MYFKKLDQFSDFRLTSSGSRTNRSEMISLKICKYAWVMQSAKRWNPKIGTSPKTNFVICCLTSYVLCTKSHFVEFICPFMSNVAFLISLLFLHGLKLRKSCVQCFCISIQVLTKNF